MIFALFALAAVMIVGGIASVVQGFPYVRLESGWTMTIAGAATASSGAILLGLAVVATHLKRLQRVLAEQGAGFRAEADPALHDASSRIDPPGLGDSGLDAETIATGRHRPSLVGLGEPSPAEPPLFVEEPQAKESQAKEAQVKDSRAEAAPPAPPLGSDPTAPLLPDLLPEPPPAVDPFEPALPRVAESDALPARRIKPNKPPRLARPTAMVDTVIPVPEPTAAAPSVPAPSRAPEAEEPLGLRPSLAGEPDAAPVPVTSAPVTPAPVEEATEPGKAGLSVVGTYASGGNTYVMYSNGSIEADTPRGQFTFNSLDELKAFVEAGGEDGARGAA